MVAKLPFQANVHYGTWSIDFDLDTELGQQKFERFIKVINYHNFSALLGRAIKVKRHRWIECSNTCNICTVGENNTIGISEY